MQPISFYSRCASHFQRNNLFSYILQYYHLSYVSCYRYKLFDFGLVCCTCAHKKKTKCYLNINFLSFLTRVSKYQQQHHQPISLVAHIKLKVFGSFPEGVYNNNGPLLIYLNGLALALAVTYRPQMGIFNFMALETN